MNKPTHLKKGDQVAIIAPSSSAPLDFVENAERAVQKMGLVPVMFPSCFAEHGHLSGTDKLRANDIQTAFSNPTIKGIVCLKGGYGTPRLLDLLDYDAIKSTPKVFIGYSDITALHIALNQNSNMITYHGPMASAGWVSNLDHYTKMYLEKALFSNEPLGSIDNPEGSELELLVHGQASGQLIGGNLSLLVSTLGSPYEIDTRGKILFIEDTHEQVYKIDRMLTSLKLAGKFTDCAGIILGTWSDCNPEFKYNKQKDLDLDLVFDEIIVPMDKPTLKNFRMGHNYPQPTLPLGAIIHIDTSNKTIIIKESSNL